MTTPTPVPHPERAENFYSVHETYPLLEQFKLYKDVLIRELNNVLSAGWMPWPEQNLYQPDEQWDIFPFFGFERDVPQNCARCPETHRLLKTVPGLKTAIYSRLGPNTQLKPHYGVAHLANRVLRCHFGLIVPEACGIWVEGETRLQEEGEWLVFDDSKSHSGLNFSDQERIVLLLDIERPLWVPQGVLEESACEDLHGLPDHWGTPADYLKRDY